MIFQNMFYMIDKTLSDILESQVSFFGKYFIFGADFCQRQSFEKIVLITINNDTKLTHGQYCFAVNRQLESKYKAKIIKQFKNNLF